ncbi:uncharacterized protein LOC141594788 [Silene latifolia]|uniref:uncharacterized protein LOC141594788 n=1 Tax=Silene latifolia TaxID=37657 RepID=UPI003D7771EB
MSGRKRVSYNELLIHCFTQSGFRSSFGPEFGCRACYSRVFGFCKLLTGVTVPIVCDTLRFLATAVPIYNDLIQALSTPSNYMKKPMEIDAYLKGCKFLPYANNEIPSARNPVYKERFSSLHNLLLVMTKFYKEDLIGLKTLYEAGKVTFKKAPGDHIHLTETLYEMITPFLIDDDDEDSTKKIAVA